MHIKKMKLSDLKTAEYNPRVDLKPGMQEYEKLKQSILEFGFVDPPIYNIQTGNLVGGHQRVAVARELGLFNEIEVSVVNLPLNKEKALNVALNKISGQWDEEKLYFLLNELDDEAVSLTGFDTEEVDSLLDSFNYEEDIEKPIIEDDFQVNKFIENHPEAKTKMGQLWKLGNHYLLCGDATKAADVEKLLQGKKANLVVTDPPYNVAVKSENKELNESGREKIMNDDMSDEEFNQFLTAVFNNYANAMENDSAIYVFHGSSYQREFENSMNAAGIVVRSQCIWVKNNATFGWSQYRWQHEPVFYAHKKKQAPSWYGDRKQTTIWQDDLMEDLPATIWKVPRDDVSTYYHPTQKPLSLIAIPVRNSSKRQDIVLDLFGGSGSTLMTCNQLDRRCYTLELDPLFCDVIIERFEKSTGIAAELIDK
ncbi:site-specific DNA-methyltransferase [Enterococcus faecalis]|uniref:site-specific DNA-methyltransferase n=1 Tax=Enterococcus faecalis TaxID=1351 RepID=UPI001927F706|nr:site-specific DNA-methyltransferase [Enterococcus faecalis]EGO8804130.1 DNA modification methylase [Enterococcus faecalis]EHU8855042.1 DNA modification methylase [Enterococcus faecalis]MCM6933720.1 site-specific DNA-methyltransferase [Enterococcus faecalis]MDF4248085.1 site-specific DNA-methyltransferase [Enterococcus faecalis]MDK4408736.1 site-specific DNA-methyltransferase [Enterococcus faecalis]